MVKVMRYQEEIEFIFEHLQSAGFEILGFKNEDGEMIDEDIAYQVTNHEEAWVRIQRRDERVRGIYFVCGNSPGEIVCDYTVSHIETESDRCPIGRATDALWAKVNELEKAMEILENAGFHISN